MTDTAIRPAASNGGPAKPERKPPPEKTSHRSYGEFVKEIAQRSHAGYSPGDHQLTVMRALVDQVTGDVPHLVHETWLPTVAGIFEASRPTVEAFTTAELPPDGDELAWPSVVSGPAVGKQSGEKTEVPSAKLIIQRAMSPVDIYGGAQDVSIQTILRSAPAYVDLLLQAYVRELAKVEDIDAIAELATATTTPVALSATGIAGWRGQFAGAARQVADDGHPADVLVAGPDLFEAITGASDSEGRGLFGDLAGLTLVQDTNMTDPATVAGFVGWSGAFTTFLGPVTNLSHDVPDKLGRDIGAYQFAAFALQYPASVVKLTYSATTRAKR